MTTRSKSFKAPRRQSITFTTKSELRPRSSTLATVSPLPESFQDITPKESHLLVHSREPRNKSRPVIELAPTLVKQDKRRTSHASDIVPIKKRRTTVAGELQVPHTEPLEISIPNTPAFDISIVLQESMNSLLQTKPFLHPLPQLPVFPDVSKAEPALSENKSNYPDFSVDKAWVAQCMCDIVDRLLRNRVFVFDFYTS